MNSQAEDTQAAARPLASWYLQGLSDGLGDRLLMFDNSGAASLELLRFRPDLAQSPGFEAALREQLHRLGRFEHAAFSRVRSVQRLEPDQDLALVSNATPGKRLSEVLHKARGPAYAATLIKQLAPALAVFQEHAAGTSHGLLNPDRIVIGPDGRLTIVEHVVGPAIDTLDLSDAQLASIGIALPPGSARIDVASDWYQLALVAMSVLLGRPIVSGDLPHLETLLDGVTHAARIDGGGLSPFVREWIERALRISGERIETGADARDALDELLRREWPSDGGRVTVFRPEPAQAAQTTAKAIEQHSIDNLEHAAPTIAAFAPRSAPRREPQPAPIVSEPVVSTPMAPPAIPEPPIQDAPVPAWQAEPAAEAPLVQAVAIDDPDVDRNPRRTSQVASIFDLRESARPEPAPTPAVHIPQEQPRPAPPLSTRPRLLDFESGTAFREPQRPAPARSSPIVRNGVPVSIVVVLALVAVVEAGAIAWMGRALWRISGATVTVESTASGENALVAHGPKQPAPLQIAVAPDLRWMRVGSPAPDGILGMKLKSTASGTLQISSPIQLKVLEGSRVVGSVPGSDLKLSVGRHELELVNESLGYRLKQTVDVEPGQTLAIHVSPPFGWITIDATPWAEASIDGQVIGRTPLGPLPLAVGEHQITFRNPAGSSDRQRVTIKADQTSRVTGTLKF
jgi:hypothetical protein